MSENEVSIGSILGAAVVDALYRVGKASAATAATPTPDATADPSVDRLMSIVLKANQKPCSRCGNAPGIQEIPGRSGVLYCPDCWCLLYGDQAAEQDLAQEHSCAGCPADTAAGRFHNQFGLPDLEKWDDAWLCESCLAGIMKRLARLLLKEFGKAPGKESGKCACCNEELGHAVFKVYLNWRRDRIPRELVSLVRWKGAILCGECGRKLRTANAVLVPISDEDRKRGKRHPFWTGKFEVRPPAAPVLDGTEPAPVVAVQEVVETTTTLVTATTTA